MPTQTRGFNQFFSVLRSSKIVTDLSVRLVNFRALEVSAIEGSLVDPTKVRLKPDAPADAYEALPTMEKRLNETWNAFVKEVPDDDFIRILLEGYMSRSVDAYNGYLTTTIKEIARQHPHALNSRHRAQLAGLTGDALDDAVEGIANSLTQGFGNAINYFRKNASLAYDDSTPDFVRAKEYILVRNLSVHNAGIVDRKFLRNSGRTDLAVDSLFPLTIDYVFDVWLPSLPQSEHSTPLLSTPSV